MTPKALLALALACGSATVAALPSYADTTYSTTSGSPYLGIEPFGVDGTNTYGQVITAPGGALTSFTFYTGYEGNTDVTAQVYEWTGTGVAGSALFSQAVTITSSETTVDTGSLALTAGEEYVLLFTDPDNDNNTSWYVAGSAVAGSYGTAVYVNGPADSASWDGPEWTQPLEFQATFGGAATPEPGSLALLGTGLVGVGSVLRRRARV